MSQYEIIELLLSYIEYAINEGFPFPIGIDKDLQAIYAIIEMREKDKIEKR